MIDLFGPARIQFCEQTLDGWIKHPADTWSNIGPIIAGIAIHYLAKTRLLRCLGLATVWMGLASAYFHASGTLLGEALDLHGMYMFLFVFMFLQRDQITPLEIEGDPFEFEYGDMLAVFILATGLAGTYLFLPEFGSVFFGLMVIIILAKQWMNLTFDRQWYCMIGTFAVGWSFWWLDYLHVLCLPGNHILTGHAVWHLVCGLVCWQVFRIYQRGDSYAR